jgi:tetratricopeptide (TPR) repeat protein
MRVVVTVGFLLLSWDSATCTAGWPPQTNCTAGHIDPAVEAVLREGSELALKQDEDQRYWCEFLLLQIGDVQIRAGDFEGAFRTIRSCTYEWGRNVGLLHLAEALARDGKREGAFDMVRLLEENSGWSVEDGVQLRWIDHLIASGDLRRAGKAIEQLKSKRYLHDGRRNLAVAYAKSGYAARAMEQFNLALDATAGLNSEFDRAKALWETADAQLSVGSVDAAKATIRRLVETDEFQDPWTKVSALKESAALAAKADDQQTARRLFGQAIEAQKAVDATIKITALRQISVAQASVGYIDDALKTALMIVHSEQDFTQDCQREQALYAIATAQLMANDTEAAVRTALSVEHFIQFRDDTLRKVVDQHIAKQELKTALTTSEKIVNPSTRATAMLMVATAHAKLGDRKIASDVAAQIELIHKDRFPAFAEKERFDYRLPGTWGVCYDEGPGFTMASHQMSIRRTAELAAAAMAFTQAMGQRPTQSYATLFNDVYAEVTQALARSHAASGDVKEALAWAKEIGSSAKINGKDDRVSWAVEQRIHALIGVAEGILDRTSKSPPQQEK